jgi:hypothetical protein
VCWWFQNCKIFKYFLAFSIKLPPTYANPYAIASQNSLLSHWSIFSSFSITQLQGKNVICGFLKEFAGAKAALCIGVISAGIFKQSMGARNRVGIGLSYRPTRLHRLAELIR